MDRGRVAVIGESLAVGTRHPGQIETLKANPKRCPIDTDSEAFGEEVRVLLHGKRQAKHRILFAIRGATVHVLTVRHSARQSLIDLIGQDDSGEGEEPFR